MTRKEALKAMLDGAKVKRNLDPEGSYYFFDEDTIRFMWKSDNGGIFNMHEQGAGESDNYSIVTTPKSEVIQKLEELIELIKKECKP